MTIQARGAISGPMKEKASGKDIRFCPYCAQSEFDGTGKGEEGPLYCEICGIDVPIKELIR